MTTASTYVQFDDGAQDFKFSVDFSYTCEKCLDPYGTGDSPTSYEVNVTLDSVTLQSDSEGVELLDFLDEDTLERIEQGCIEYAIEEES
jgi:hypothetical protein